MNEKNVSNVPVLSTVASKSSKAANKQSEKDTVAVVIKKWPSLYILNRIGRSVIPGTLVIMAMLILREAFPGAAAHMPHVYAVFDRVFIPVYEFAAKVVLKAVDLLLMEPWFQSFLNWLQGLVL